ncbi:MAG TPA: ELWxxDGT repeat protein [Parafilimonas sp.]|nr:ELWxxDGT repeat protein [Parafilimonas sp.]
MENNLADRQIAFYTDTLTHRKLYYRTADYSIVDKSAYLQEISGKNSITTGGDSGFHLIRDINTRSNSSPNNFTISNFIDTLAMLNNVCYFFANDGVHGFEVWRSDGTDTGTFRMSDIIKDSAVVSIGMELVAGKQFLYFTAYKPDGAYCVFKLDPVNNVIQTLFELNSNEINPVESLHFLNDTLYFVVTDGSYANQLWKSDGTVQGTVLVKDINTDMYGDDIHNLTQSGNLLYFSANTSTYGYELWRTDGTNAGTFMIKDTKSSSPNTNIYFVTPLNNKVYYVQRDGTTNKLWVSDGSNEGTLEIKNPQNANIEIYSSYHRSRTFTIIDSTIFFSANTPAIGTDLWKYNTAGKKGIELVKNIDVGYTGVSSFNQLIASIKGVVFFMYKDSANVYHLYKTRGSTLSTQLVRDFNFSNIYSFYGKNNKIYFIASTAETGYEPWICDGTAAGTFMVKDINPGTFSSSPQYFGYCNNNFLFAANDDKRGTELWRITRKNKAQLVKDINTSTNPSSSTANFIPFRNGVLFTATNYNNANELWQSDGNTAVVIKDTLQQTILNPSDIQVSNNAVYVLSNARSIYSIKGNDTAATKSLSASYTIPYYTVRDSGTIIYSLATSPYSSLMKKNENDTAVLLKANITVSNLSNIANDKPSPAFLTIGNITYFQGYDESGVQENELWKTDGTPGGTTLIKFINLFGGASYPYLFTNYNNRLYFRADDNSGNALWRSDGTTQGTVKVATIIPSEMIVYNNRLFISAYTTNQGYELWMYDGSAVTMVKDINFGANSSNPSNFFVYDNSLYFTANDGIYGTELWKTDGTRSGTKMLKDLTPGSGSSKISGLTTAAYNLFFNKDGILWMSNGIEETTMPVPDPALTYVIPTNVTSNGNLIYFSGTNAQNGTEPWAGNVFKYYLKCFDSDSLKPKISQRFAFCHDSYTELYTRFADNYLWNTGDKTQIIGVTNPGTYSVRIRLRQGCYTTSDPFELKYTCYSPVAQPPVNPSATSATLNWYRSSCTIQYKIQLKQQGVPGNTTFIVDSSKQSFTLNGLKPNTTYKWRIASVCQLNPQMVSTWSSYQIFKTPTSLIVSDSQLSASQSNTSGKVSLYPNPCTDFVTIITPYMSSEIILSDVAGRQLSKIKAGKGNIRIPVAHLTKGIYIVIIKTIDSKHTLQFVKTE